MNFARSLLSAFKVDFASSGRPGPSNLIAATAVALVGSVFADWLLTRMGVALFPSTKGYVHFQFFDYAKLTIVGVLIACAAWPVVTLISSAPRWLFARLAVLVTLVLLLPDVWLLIQNEPSKAVAVLVAMHLAIAVVTYNALVHIAPPQPLHQRSTRQESAA